ncbi:MAG: PQQ-binding-like beta-propeller repeat protein [Acidimicrobiales bacterium]
MCAVIAAAFLFSSFAAGVADSSATSLATSSWSTYHGNVAGSARAHGLAFVDTRSAKWTSPTLDGALYGEPLVFGNDVYVATENDSVYALSSTTGRVIWRRHVANAVPSSQLPCGDISPEVGITGTPVIDVVRDEIFLVADEMVRGRSQHELVGLSTQSGAQRMSRDVDPPGSASVALLERTGLTLDKGRVIFGFGGNYGDCAAYRGRVVSASETRGHTNYFTVDRASGESQGAVWMGGAAPAVDASGNVWVSVGNGSVNQSGHRFDDSDSVLELSSTMRLLQYFAPSSWPQNNGSDLDMSMEPALLSDGRVVIAGKSRIIYLLNGRHLGGIGHQQASLTSGCSDDVDGGGAVNGTTVYLPCVAGTIALRVSSTSPGLHVLWSATSGGGPPIIAAGLVWSIGQNGVLYGLNPSNGTVHQQVNIGAPINHFPTPSVGDGLLVAPSANRVIAFRMFSAH